MLHGGNEHVRSEIDGTEIKPAERRIFQVFIGRRQEKIIDAQLY